MRLRCVHSITFCHWYTLKILSVCPTARRLPPPSTAYEMRGGVREVGQTWLQVNRLMLLHVHKYPTVSYKHTNAQKHSLSLSLSLSHTHTHTHTHTTTTHTDTHLTHTLALCAHSVLTLDGEMLSTPPLPQRFFHHLQQPKEYGHTQTHTQIHTHACAHTHVYTGKVSKS